MKLKYIFLFIVPVIYFVVYGDSESPSVNLFDSQVNRQFADQTINQFMQKYQIPGLSIAIAKEGEIVFSKGYGFADRKKGVAVNERHQFRIASISKPITAVAIMQLRDQGKLNLDDKVFGASGILHQKFPVKNDYLNKITVRHLLEHTAGKAWTNDNNDPMFKETELSRTALIRWVLKNRRLSKTPGSEYAYSNFGYSLLGRVIEEVSGEVYKDYVNKHIFQKINADSFELGSQRKAGSTAFQVHYYSDTEESPYWFPVARMDSHGGWISNATDLVKFSMSVDGRGKDILSPESIKLMTTPSTQNNNYALGWNVNQYNNWWHIGSLPGTASVMVRAENGYNWAVLLNKRSEDKNFMGDLDGLTWNIIKGIKVLN
jgi:CubicO group peptidase (beta-lactamase class C family)